MMILKLRNNFKVLKTLTFYIVILIFAFLTLNLSRAQQTSPQFLITWQAESYAPGWYQGKIFPTRNSPIKISFELLDKGALVDLSRTAVRWYVNDQLLRNENNGLGIKNLNFSIADYAGQETAVRISLPNYKGSSLDQIVRIPVMAPEAVIDVPSPDRNIGAGDNYFTALPFFFNVTNLNNLSFVWLANDEPASGPTDNPWILKLNVDAINMPSGFIINLRSTVKNYQNEAEFAGRDAQLQVK